MKLAKRKLYDEVLDQIDALRCHCESFEASNYTTYKAMSVCLRLLLLGSSGDPALLEEVLPKIQFGPLLFPPRRTADAPFITPCKVVVTNDAGGTLHYSPGGTMPFLGISDGGIVLSATGPVGGAVLSRTKLGPLFHPLAPRIDIQQWLDQAFLSTRSTLGDFIKRVANKDGGAHIGTHKQLTAVQNFGNIHRHLLNAIARYVGLEVSTQFAQTYPAYRREPK